MRILFWNTNKNSNINKYIASVVQDDNIDILAMAECNADYNELYMLLGGYQQSLIKCNTYGCDRIDIWSSYVSIKPAVQNKYYSIQIFKDEYILCCVHLMSDLHGDKSKDRLAKIQEIVYDISKTESVINSQKTVIIGDFNEMPYGEGCLNANGFHGLPVLNIFEKPTRTVNGTEYI